MTTQMAILKQNHGRPGAQLVPLEEAIEGFKSVAKYFNATYEELIENFEKAGFNVFHPHWKQYLEKIRTRGR